MNRLQGIRKCISISEEDLERIKADENLSKAMEELIDVCEQYQEALKKKSDIESKYASAKYSLFSALEDMKRMAIQISGLMEYTRMRNMEIPDNILDSISYIIEKYMVTRMD
ncbi:hypothetical protein DMB44_01400 [Thermoplasma sp. Kam2015]|uniref:hypothetical protein n=1 Tax=Thermoplasma sp. Kam2015 TaxID=2094122 RepID=UPI000D930B9B|nr:hypothetical protein [Thermoplasma sp. Kam2015]PYB68932.1 hypothetical protein DMB44_01400 [Thermoplasma sp. Kam2015]